MKHTPKINRRNGPAKFPGIVNDALELGVTRQHLHAVLTGKRPSARLLSRYSKLKRTAA